MKAQVEDINTVKGKGSPPWRAMSLQGGGEAPDEARHSGSAELAEDLDLFVQASAGRFAKPPEQGPP
jgi:hypothetical protein